MTTPPLGRGQIYDRRSSTRTDDASARTPAIDSVTAPVGPGSTDDESEDYRSFASVALGVYLVVVLVLLVDLTVRLWPPAAFTSATREALERRSLLLEARARADSDSVASLLSVAPAAATAAQQAALAQSRGAFAESRARAVAARRLADSVEERAILASVTPGDLHVLFGWVPVKGVSFDVRLILLAMVIGALGSFVHIAQSYATFVGNRTLKHSWTWWYVLRPFIGGALAAVVYFAIRGALFPSAASLAGEMSPFGVAAMAALAGMFSKQAVDKLNEVFSTMFRTQAEITGDAGRKDKASSEASAGPAAAAAAGAAAPAADNKARDNGATTAASRTRVDSGERGDLDDDDDDAVDPTKPAIARTNGGVDGAPVG